MYLWIIFPRDYTISLYSPGINRHAPARHGEAGAGHVHRLAGHGELGGARLRHAARVADRDLGPEPRVPDLWVRNISINIVREAHLGRRSHTRDPD